jgi:hypothetical protein
MSTIPKPRDRTPSVTYRESEQRQAEREEAMAVRIAMEELALQEEEKIYKAARDEAAELVWKHVNPNAPENNPDAPYAYPAKEVGSNQRSRSLGRDEQDLQRSQSKKLRQRNSMGSSTSGSRSSSLQGRRIASGSSVTASVDFAASPTKENFELGAGSYFPAPSSRKSSNPTDPKSQRRSSSARRKASGSLFKNPDDQIYEEPEEEAPPPALTNPPPPAKLPLGVRRNPFSRLQFTKDNNFTRSQTDPIMSMKRFDRYDIHKNPVTRSRDAAYTSSPPIPKEKAEKAPDVENEPEVKMKDGKEIRGDDIRAATQFKLKDRSAKLPTPTLVSDSPGRPIVSFTKDLKPKEIELEEVVSSFPGPVAQEEVRPRPMSKAQTAPVVPNIHNETTKRTMAASPSPFSQPQSAPTSRYTTNAMPSAPPTRVNRAQIPAINVYEDPPARPLPNVNQLRKVNPHQSAAPSVPTINVYQAPPARSKSTPAPPIPTISVQETPSSSVNAPGRGRFNVKAPSPSVPSISVNEPSSRPIPRINAPSTSVTPSAPSVHAQGSPSMNISKPPSINVQGPPVININNAPSINVNGPPASTRPLPNPRNHTSPFPRTNTGATRSHWTPVAATRTGVLCAQCALPISGRIVSAAGFRFHPECFQCHHCGEHLECVAFYPEPSDKYAARVARIQARQRGEDIAFIPSRPTSEDMMRLEQEDSTDETMRFYCHLDFHELFSPRCKSCKTPIEGEVVVACGAEWHVGHFFCAQCGDPFDSSTPFVEKEGYAWCVGCHTNRFSTKCKKCRKPVTDTVVKALGNEWHQGCFCCMVSQDTFLFCENGMKANNRCRSALVPS